MGNSSNYSRQKIQYVLTIFLFFITSSLFSQTVIREKIIINPEKKNKAELSRTETSSESIVIKWKDTTVSVSFLVSSPCDEQVYIPWHTGTSFSYSFSTTSTGYYGVQIRMNFQRMVPVEVDYSFQTGESGTIVIQPNLSGNFSFANLYGYYESINDFYLGFTNSVICDENSVVRLAPYIINNYNCESNAPFNSLSPATVKLESELDCYLFNSKEQTELGKISEINLGKLKDIEIRLRNKYEGTERKIIEVKLQVGDITRNREVIVEGKGNYQLYYYYAEDEDERILPGIKKLLEVEAYSDNYCNSYLLPDSTKFNVEIISGEQYGVCKELENGIEGKILIGLNHQEGILKFLLSSNGKIPSGKDSIKVRVWTTDNKIKPIEIPLVILQPRIKVIFSPANIMPGDTADVVLKKIDDSGNIVDFEEEQRFDVKIVDGREYGDLIIPQWEEITDESWYVEQGFKFIASAPIENLPVESLLMVKTSEGFAGSKLPVDRSQKEDYKKHSMSFIKRTNQLQKSNTTENNKPPDINKSMMIGDPEELWGIGSITIGENPNRFYIKAYFEKSVLIPGDTVNVIVKKVDKDGNESEFPSGTEFEAGIKEGCALGDLLSPSGATGKFFSNISSPIRFIVADSLGQDSIVVLRVGVSDTDLVKSVINKTTQNINRTIIKEGTNAKTGKDNLNYVMDDTYCSVGNYIYENKDFPSAVVEDIKIKITLSESEIRPLKTGGNSITNAKIKVTSGGQPLANKSVKITINRIEKSGGHDHPNSPDFNLWGRITVQGKNGNPVTAITDNNGEINTDEILASEFGGEYFVEASLESNPSVKNKTDLKIRVPDLQLLPESIYYDKIGGTEFHYGPRSRPNEDHNHWGTKELINKIQSLSLEWFNLHTTVPKLAINDMSLPFGGGFDINGLWTYARGHDTHRSGDCVDIQSKEMKGERWIDKKPYNGWHDEGEVFFDDNENGTCDSNQLKIFRGKVQQTNITNAILEFPNEEGKEHWHLITR